MRRIALLISLVIITTSCILLLNFTATNPTGRRYSSAPVVVDGSSNAKGSSAETVLSNDLGVSKNNFNFDGVIPDFVTPFYVIEAKNCAALPCENRGQFEREVSLAIETGRPLWVYTRVDTKLHDETMIENVSATGGAIVPYFTASGYVDPIDRAATYSLISGVSVFAVVGSWELFVLRKRGFTVEIFMLKREKPMNKENRNRLIAIVVVLAVAVLLITNRNALYTGMATINSIASTVFYVVAALWLIKHF